MTSQAAIHRVFPEHQADLEKSGLSLETIQTLGIYSAEPDELEPLIGWTPSGVKSALVFPYPGEEGFCRVKIFPPIKDEDGHTVKYLQRPKTGCGLYIPSLAQQVLSNPTIPLGWTEGEKKAASACQEGLHCNGLGGLWNWLEGGKPIERLDTIAHVERLETLYMDSGVWVRPDLIRAVYAFGKELESRGAKVLVAVFSPKPNGDEQKLDEFLREQGLTGLQTLSYIPLRHAAFRKASSWWKGWQAKAEGNGHQHLDSMALLERMQEMRTLRPALDFVDGQLYVGILADSHLAFVTSERGIRQPHELADGLTLDNRGFDLCQFSKERIVSFLGGAAMTGYILLRKLEHYFNRFMVYPKKDLALLFAIWTLGTYLYVVFEVYAYLLLRSPRKRCGKSRLEDLIALVAFNASPPTTEPSEAMIFRDPATNGGTLLLDEVEGLRGDKERFAGLLAVLNSGFQRGREVSRMEKRGDRFVKVNYPTYAPRVLAGISKLAETLEDRGIMIFLQRKRRDEKIERFSPRRMTKEVQVLRDDCYVWALTHATDVAEVYEAGLFPDLDGLDDRARDLWEPLMTIAYLADQEAKDAGELADFARRLKALAMELCMVRDEGDTATATLIEALLAILQDNKKTEWDIEPTSLLPLVQAKGFEWVKSPKKLAEVMNGLGIYKQGITIPGKKKPKGYRLSAEKLADLKARYGPPEENEAGEQ